MLLRGAEANRYLAQPDPARAGLLIYGTDPMRVALKRQQAIAALIGPQGEAEMRLQRMTGGDLRKDASLLTDAVKAIGFFPGARVAFVEDATDGLRETIAAAVASWKPGDASIIVTANALTAKSALKVFFETHPNAICIALFDDPPTREEIEAELRKSGLGAISPEVMADLTTLARALDPGDFRQTLEKIALYKWQDKQPLTSAEVAALAPATIEAEIDDLLYAVADRQVPQAALLVQRVAAQGTLPVTLCIQALRYFRSLHMAACDSSGSVVGLQKARVFGPRRDRMQRQLRLWRLPSIELAVAHLIETDLALRSSTKAPGMALMERALLRIASLRD